MNVIQSSIPDMLIIEPRVFEVEFGFAATNAITARYVQNNQSRPVKNVLRRLRYRIQPPQGNSETSDWVR